MTFSLRVASLTFSLRVASMTFSLRVASMTFSSRVASMTSLFVLSTLALEASLLLFFVDRDALNSLDDQRILLASRRWQHKRLDRLKWNQLERCLRRICQRCCLCDFTRHVDDLARGHVAGVCHDDHETARFQVSRARTFSIASNPCFAARWSSSFHHL